MKYDVFGIGNALVDVLMNVDHSVFDELGLTKGQMHLMDEDKLKLFEQKIINYDKKIMPGGSAANTLVGVAGLGGSAFFVGKVGDDEHGSFYEEKLLGHGVKSGIIKEKGLTGRAVTIITPDFERTFVVHLGVSANLKKHEILGNDIKNSRFLHVEAYQLEDPSLRETAMEAMRIANENMVLVSLDLGDSGIVKRNREDIWRIAEKYVNILFANEEEAKALTGMEPEEALHEIANIVNIVIVKVGADGSFIKKQDKVYKIPGFRAKAVDTTGAGDIYAAGILYGLSQEYPIEKAGKLASLMGSKVVEMVGARLDTSTISDIKKNL